MTTKKELQDEFKISIDQVRKAIEAAGLDTGKTSYSDHEVKMFIRPAIQALYLNERKSTAEQVEKWANGVRKSQKKVDYTSFDKMEERTLGIVDDTLDDIFERNAERIVERVYDKLAEHADSDKYRGAAQAYRMRAASRMMDNQFESRPPRGLGGAPHHDDDTIDAEAYEVPEGEP